ncbi:MAG: hypothetical protein KatS3mg002_0157 [Candidatus Woesearchaeota archaeon]|nr:MAG: hypothetical protein KatS3mg002_0157 [Candidatus Woesearchaeota archaeon]
MKQETNQDKNFKHIVRLVNTDLNGEKKTHMALHKIKGISFMFSNFVCYAAKVDPEKKAGYLTEEEINRIEDVIKKPFKI